MGNGGPTTTKRQLTDHEIECIARAAHEVNRSYCSTMGDHSHKPWHLAPDWQRSSCRQGVLNIATAEMTPEQSHESWFALKRSEGWKYGEVKDEEKKTHPCMVPYADLPEEQRYKDVLYTTVVKGLIDGLWRRPQ